MSTSYDGDEQYEVHPGDTADFTYHDVEVLTVTSATRPGVASVRLSNGALRSIRLEEVEVSNLRRKPKVPLHWPPQPGDVWRNSDNTEFHARLVELTSTWTTIWLERLDEADPGYRGAERVLAAYPQLKLVYRKGDS